MARFLVFLITIISSVYANALGSAAPPATSLRAATGGDIKKDRSTLLDPSTSVARALTLPPAAASQSTGANLLINGGFELFSSENAVTGPGFFIFNGPRELPGGGWSVTSGSIDIMVGSSETELPPFEGTTNLDLNGMGPGAISQTVALVVGEMYSLAWRMCANWYNGLSVVSMNVLLNGAVVASPTFVNSQGGAHPCIDYAYMSFDFVATAAITSVGFQSAGSGGPCGPVLDDIRLFHTPGETSSASCSPTPSSTGSGTPSVTDIPSLSGSPTSSATPTPSPSTSPSVVPCCLFFFSGRQADNPLCPCAVTGQAGVSFVPNYLGTSNAATNFALNSYAQCTSETLPGGNSPRTFSARVKCPPTGSLSYAAVLEYGKAGSRYSVGQTSDLLRFVDETNDVFTSAVLCNNAWRYLVLSFDGTTLRFFLDDVLVASETTTLATSSRNVISLAWNGYPTHFGGEPMAVTLSDIRVYGSALSAAEVVSEGLREISRIQAVLPGYSYNAECLLQLCAAGSFCPGGSLNSTHCPAGTFSAPGASSCTPCPANTSAPSPGATSCQPCPAGAASPEGSPACFSSASAGAPCTSAATCASSACRAGFCCSSASALSGCTACLPGSGACVGLPAGEACSVSADCGATGLCAGGCCCSAAALLTPGCTACRCWVNASTTPATAGACLAAPPLPPPPPTCACAPPSPTPTPPLPTSVGGCLACEAFDASRQVDGLFILSASNSLNKAGVDLALGLPGACASLHAAAASQGLPAPEVAALLPCLSAPTYLMVEGVNYTVLGPAAPLRLAARPEDCGGGASPPPAPAPFPCSAPAGSYCAAAAPPATRCASVPSTAVPWATAANPASPLPCTACTPPVAIPLSGLSSPLSILATGGAWGSYGGVDNSFPLEGVATAVGTTGNCVVGGVPYPCFYMEEAQVCPAGAPAGACCNLTCGNQIYPGLPFVWSFAGPTGVLLAPPRFGPVAGGVAAPPAAAQVLLGVNDLDMRDNVGAIIVCVQGMAVLPCPAGLHSEAGAAKCV
jgi:hypothetical protein